ncbi:MAG: lanthionine synthetase LanC family protein, partial [Sciscionella sp.]
GPLQPSWCYGTPGIARAQQLAALATGDTRRRHTAETALLGCLHDPNQLARIIDPGLCHGGSAAHHLAHGHRRREPRARGLPSTPGRHARRPASRSTAQRRAARRQHRRRAGGYAALLRVTLPQSQMFLEHLAAHGIPNNVGTFGLTAADQRALFVGDTPATCRTAAAVLDSTLAVVLTEHDDDGRLHHYAHTIAREARQWASA